MIDVKLHTIKGMYANYMHASVKLSTCQAFIVFAVACDSSSDLKN